MPKYHLPVRATVEYIHIVEAPSVEAAVQWIAGGRARTPAIEISNNEWRLQSISPSDPNELAHVVVDQHGTPIRDYPRSSGPVPPHPFKPVPPAFHPEPAAAAPDKIVSHPIHECQDCHWKGIGAELDVIVDLLERVAPGEPMPSGQCPACGALCHKEVAG